MSDVLLDRSGAGANAVASRNGPNAVPPEHAGPNANAVAERRATILSIVRGSLAIIAVMIGYECAARFGGFSPALLPTLPKIGWTFVDMFLDGSMFGHIAATMTRVLVGFAIAIAIAVPLGILMGRFRPVERFFLPLASAFMPIPSLAWVPVFILWLGIGGTVAIVIVVYAALFPLLLNTWSGVRSVNPLWLRAAGAMGAGENALFWRVILPGAFPFIIAGLRQAFVRAWIAVVGAEMLAASDWGLGWKIFDAKEFLNADVMLASVAVIGIIGFADREGVDLGVDFSRRRA
jgi:NitT/TauT family transport system permease protein